MLRFAADENFNGAIVRGLLRRNSALDIVRIQDVGLSGADDPSVLEWAASQGRILLTHDVSTLAKHAFDRAAAGATMPGVFAVPSVAPIGRIIDDLILLAECSLDGEWEGRCASCRSSLGLSGSGMTERSLRARGESDTSAGAEQKIDASVPL